MNQNLEIKKVEYSNAPVYEDTESGLNLSEIKNTILRHLPLIAGCTVTLTSLALLKTLVTPPVYLANFEILSEPVNIETRVTSTNDKSRETREQIGSVKLDDVQLKILKSPRLISRAIESLQEKYPGLTYQKLISNLTVDFISDGNSEQNILLVVYSNPDKQKVSDVIDILTKTYLDYSVEKRLSGVKRGIAFLDRQIPRVSEEVKNLENQIKELRSNNNFIEPQVSLKPIADSSNAIAKEGDRLAIRLQELKFTANNLERELATESGRSTTALNLATPRYKKLVEKLETLDTELALQSAVYNSESGVMSLLQQERQNIVAMLVEAESDIRQKLDNQIAALENRQRNIATETSDVKLQLEDWSSVSSQYNTLKQRLALANKKLNEFTLQRDSLLIDAAQKEAPWQLLTPATEPKTNNVSTINYLLLSSTLGTILGIGIALLKDKQQKIIYTSAKVEQLTNLPILASIPYIPRSKKFPVLKPASVSTNSSESEAIVELNNSIPRFSVSSSIEAFRSFAVNLGFFNFAGEQDDYALDTKVKSVVITSAIPREGKSTVALNLARASASMGKRVLLVDTDLRSDDCLTKTLGLEAKIGLRNLLNHNNPEMRLDCIQKLSLEDNLYLLTSGHEDLSTQQNPSRLLASGKMSKIIEKLRESFDLVIYDLCAIVGFADVNLLAKKTDGIIVVTGLGKIQTAALNEALSQLKLCQAPTLGVAINKIK
ncbi:MAG: AAA family ATPase [Cyanobacteria bacterium J06631_2]